MQAKFQRFGAALVGGVLLSMLAACERPPVQSVQHGYRGTGMAQVFNPRSTAVLDEKTVVPEAIAPASPDGPKAKDVYQNVKVLGDLSVGEFARHMTAITQWVAPEQGCGYCHNLQNFADDAKYTKVVARRMTQMTQAINSQWKNHVGDTGVTCYTCHRGNNIPNDIWFKAPGQANDSGFIASMGGQNSPNPAVGMSSLPYDAFSPYIQSATGAENIRVAGKSSNRTNTEDGSAASIRATEGTYGLMMHMSTSLGVNCTYCHNSRNFADWDQSSPQRSTAWYGIRMLRDLNSSYMEPLTSVFPANRLGPDHGDVAKANCTTCHQGAYKPLWGAKMAQGHPELLSAVKTMAAAPAAVAAPAAAVAAVATTAPASASLVRATGSTVFYEVGSAALTPAATKTVADLAEAMKRDTAAKASISGFHSAAGNLASNQDLAKRRAFSVRDALKAAGIDEGRVLLQKPQSAEANLSGEDPKSRRVEITVER
jgi:photosynthetic reaction center cytochrome c subunit